MPVPDHPPKLEAAVQSPAKLTSAEVADVLSRLRTALPNTQFEAAWAAELPGFVAVRLLSGEVAYADKSGRYLILGLVLDTATGAALDRQLEGHQ